MVFKYKISPTRHPGQAPVEAHMAAAKEHPKGTNPVGRDSVVGLGMER